MITDKQFRELGEGDLVKSFKVRHAEQQVQKLWDRLVEDHQNSLPLTVGNVVERAVTTHSPLVAIVQMPDGKFRVVSAIPYVNRATRPQVTVYLKDFSDLDSAETLYLNILECNGALGFGDVFRLSVGSGLRYVETID